MSYPSESLDNRINNADRLQAQVKAVADLVGHSELRLLDKSCIANAAWLVDDLLEQLMVERRAIEAIAMAVKP